MSEQVCACVCVQYTYNAPLDVATTSGSCVEIDMRNTHTQV